MGGRERYRPPPQEVLDRHREQQQKGQREWEKREVARQHEESRYRAANGPMKGYAPGLVPQYEELNYRGREEPYKVPTPQEMEERKRQEEAKAVAYEKQQRLVGQVARAPPHPGEQIGDSSQDTTHTGVCWACRRKRAEGRCSGESPKCSQCIKGDIK